MKCHRILAVDDEPYILKILSFKLRVSGMVPFEAIDGEQALRILREERPDLVLLDVSLPTGLSGFDILRIIRENPSTARIPVIMLTARNLPADRARGTKLGATAYITKPFSTKNVVEEIHQALASAKG